MFVSPKRILEQSYIGEGMTVIDIGSGSGHFTLQAAEKVGPFGKVYAIDIHHDMLLRLKSEALKMALTNIEILNADVEKEGSIPLKEGFADRIIIANVLFQIHDKHVLAKECKRILKKRGKVIIVDWKESYNGMGPSIDHVVKEEAVIKIWTEAGFVVEKHIDGGSQHYAIIFS